MEVIGKMNLKVDMSEIKIAATQHPVSDLIRKRWSARAFTPQPIEEYKIKTIFEAASWAPSSNNEQPWQYLYATRDSEYFDKIWSCLAPGNQSWTQHAYMLIVSLGRKTVSGSGKENFWTPHDVGMANAMLLLQATAMNVYAHPMAGYDKKKLHATLNLSEDLQLFCVIAMGYLGKPEMLDEPYRTMEMTPRSRKPIEEWLTRL